MENYPKALEKENQRHREKIGKIMDKSGVLDVKKILEEMGKTAKECNDLDTEIYGTLHKTLYHMTPRKRTMNKDESAWKTKGITIREDENKGHGVFRYNSSKKLGSYALTDRKEEIVECYDENKKRKLASEILNEYADFEQELKGEPTIIEKIEVDSLLTPALKIEVRTYGANVKRKKNTNSYVWPTIHMDKQEDKIIIMEKQDFEILVENMDKLKPRLEKVYDRVQEIHEKKKELLEYYRERLSKYAVVDML